MPRKTPTDLLHRPIKGADAGLALKDGLREARFNLRRGARKLVEAVESATSHRGEEAREGPLALLGDPLNAAVRTTATILSTIDHAMVDLLTTDGQYRTMAVPLRKSASYFGSTAGVSGADLRLFTTDHLWRYRHWLQTIGRSDAFVHERAIEQAAEQVDMEPEMRTMRDDGHAVEAMPRAAAAVVRALQVQGVLSTPSLLGGPSDADLADLMRLGAVVVVLAGELAPMMASLDVRLQTVQALTLAHEIAVAERLVWEQALAGVRPLESMGRWIAFVLRYA